VKRRATAAALALALALAGRASAHQEPYSHVEVRVGPTRMEGRVMGHVVDLAHEAGLPAPDSLFDARYVAARLAGLHAMLESRLMLLADGRRFPLRWGSFEIVRDRRSVSFDWSAEVGPPGVLELRGRLFPYDPPHETYFNVYHRGALELQALLDHAHPDATWYSGGPQGVWAVVQTFVLQGIHHIFVGPDHILFIVGLLLLGGSIGRLLKIVTAFTAAHSITLALAALRVVDPPARVIEPLIALSIVFIGVETLLALRRPRDWRARIAFAFGFIHGFGFAGVLREFGLPPGALGWSLASFNAGVEIGQACIVLSVAPALALLHSRRPMQSRTVVAYASAAIIVAGAWWFFQRVWLAA
jgi:hydrogenase/urease accessory protein HupE